MGHLSERTVSSGNCIACLRIDYAAWQKANPEKASAKQQRYLIAHPERPLAYRQANKEKIAQRSRAYKQANPDKIRADTRKWHAAHPEVVKNWRKANPEAYRAQVQTRHAREANAEGKHTAADLKERLKQQKGRCAYCGVSIKTTWTVVSSFLAHDQMDDGRRVAHHTCP